MVKGMENVMRLELHALIPRFAKLRLRDAPRLRRLVNSIEHNGQLMPVVAVPEPGDDLHWVLIDGYRRLQALQALGEDLIWVDVWEHTIDEALLLCLARGAERAWEAIEEAALIQELCARYSLRQIAVSLSRDVSWVSRRLNLFKALPEDLLEAVRQGKISLWAASRILAPLARANTAHARLLLAQLEQHPLSTRELKRLYSHYKQANQAQRQRLVQAPLLFFQALQTHEQTTQAKRLADGPEGVWCKDLAVVSQILKRLLEQVPTLFAAEQVPGQRKRLQQAFEQMKNRFERLEQILEEVSAHDPV
jgi:ParB family transcriptional regulator, chromosome partitioning protein